MVLPAGKREQDPKSKGRNARVTGGFTPGRWSKRSEDWRGGQPLDDDVSLLAAEIG